LEETLMEFTQEHDGIRRNVRRHSREGGNPRHEAI
jgi:hypothetical protein